MGVLKDLEDGVSCLRSLGTLQSHEVMALKALLILIHSAQQAGTGDGAVRAGTYIVNSGLIHRVAIRLTLYREHSKVSFCFGPRRVSVRHYMVVGGSYLACGPEVTHEEGNPLTNNDLLVHAGWATK
jgi:hypothetical protein